MKKIYGIVFILLTTMMMLLGCSEWEDNEELIQQVKAEAKEENKGITIKGVKEDIRSNLNTTFPEHVPFPERYKINTSTNSSNNTDTIMSITFIPQNQTFKELQQMYKEFVNKNKYHIDLEDKTDNQYQLYITKDSEKINLRVRLNDEGEVSQVSLSYLLEEN